MPTVSDVVVESHGGVACRDVGGRARKNAQTKTISPTMTAARTTYAMAET